VLLSRFPVVNSGGISFGELSSLSGWADIVVMGDTLRVYILHLASNKITEESEQLIEEGKLREGRTWIAAGSLVRKYSSATARRARQADVIRGHIDASPYPVIVMGDFNDTPQSYAYATICGETLHDSFVARGSGIGTTYAGSIPGLRIDYILTDLRIPVMLHEVPKLPYSDHYPVVAGVLLSE
jgi:endonuclease/exonuclease/phosphatase family metal-dependent hydrolase